MKKIGWIVCVFILVGGVSFIGYQSFIKKDVAKSVNNEEFVEKEEPSKQKNSNTVTNEKALSDEKVHSTVKQIYQKFNRKIYEIRDQNNWSTINGDNPPDIEIINQGISPYTTAHFQENIIPPMMELLYCECDGNAYPDPNFDIRFRIIANKPDYVKVRSAAFATEGNGAQQVFITLKKENKKWKLDNIHRIDSSEKPLNVTKAEAEQFIKETYPSAVYLKESLNKNSNYDENNEKVYLFYVEKEKRVLSISHISGYLDYEVSTESLPNFLQNSG